MTNKEILSKLCKGDLTVEQATALVQERFDALAKRKELAADALAEPFERFFHELDNLVLVLALARQDILDSVAEVEALEPWFEPEEHGSILPDPQLNQIQVAHGVFLLAYSYFEAFAGDVLHILYRQFPETLPKADKLTYKDILSAENRKALVEIMIDRSLNAMNSLETKLKHLLKELGMKLRDCPPLIQEAHVARNALIHNSGRVNRDPKGQGRWKLGDRVSYDAAQVYKFLLAFRGFGDTLSGAVEKRLVGSIE
jgi:hypothetical protein